MQEKAPQREDGCVRALSTRVESRLASTGSARSDRFCRAKIVDCMARAFISYKHDAQPDVRIAEFVYDLLPRHGQNTFIDRQIAIGQEWPGAIEAELNN